MDRWGRPTFEDGLNMVRGAMAIQGVQRQQKAFNEQEITDKYFGMKIKGEEVSKDDKGYNPTADLNAEKRMNEKWAVGNNKGIAEANDRISAMSDDQVLALEPKNYGELVAASKRFELIRSNKQNRAVIDQINRAKATEVYGLAMTGLNDAKEKLKSGDAKGAADNLVKISRMTNDPFKVRPSEDGKTIELYYTKDGIDQPGQKYTIDQAMQIAEKHFEGDNYFKAYLQNIQATQKINEKYINEPLMLAKGNKRVGAVFQKDLRTNQSRWNLYDENGNNPYGGPISDLNQAYKDGWKPYDSKAVDEALKREKLVTGIEKDKIQAQKAQAELESIKAGEKDTPKSWSKEWWPQTPNEKEGGDNPVTEARAIVAKSYDTSSKQTRKLISGQILPEYKRWVDQNKDQMVMGEDGQERPLNSQDLQNAFDHIAYDIIQKSKPETKPETPAKTESAERQPISNEPKKEAEKPAEQKQKVTPAGTIDGFDIGVDADGNPLIKDGKTWRPPKTRKEQIAVGKISDWRSKVKVDTGEYNPRKPMKFY